LVNQSDDVASLNEWESLEKKLEKIRDNENVKYSLEQQSSAEKVQKEQAKSGWTVEGGLRHNRSVNRNESIENSCHLVNQSNRVESLNELLDKID
jgi:hypothetical protein